MDPREAAVDAETERLRGVFLHIRLLAETRGLDIPTAGDAAVREGLVEPRDWALVREAIRDQSEQP
jgi:hypothetical protein